MSWEIVVGIITLFGFGVAVVKPIINLNTNITHLTDSIKNLTQQIAIVNKRLDAHSDKIDDHEKRIIRLESKEGKK